MDGGVSACIRVDAVASGTYTVALDQELNDDTARPPVTGARVVGPGPPVRLTLSPPSGAPGTTVAVEGTLQAPLAAAPDHADLCWDGCAQGLHYEGVSISWLSPTTFRTELVVPAAPWIDTNPARVVPLASGSFPIDVACLGAGRGCGLGSSEGSAAFELQVPTSPTLGWCPSGPSCATLAVSPGTALPGELVHVTGFAPLVMVIGSDQPFVFQLETLPGLPVGPAVALMPQPKGGTQARLGHAPLVIEAPPSFATLLGAAPRMQETTGLVPVSSNPTDPSRVAWCSGGTVVVSGQSGDETVATTGVLGVLGRLGFAVPGAPTPVCTAVALAAGSRQPPPAVVASFGGAPGGVGPPFVDVALFTVDSGRTWEPVPVPPGSDAGAFGGFRYQGGAVAALFAGAGPDLTPLVELSDDGEHWHQGQLACPSVGPCLTFGSFSEANCGMHEDFQALLRSADDGNTWTEPGWPSQVDACDTTELAATSADAALLLDPASPYALLRSTDGGETWTDIALPLLADQQPGQGFAVTPAGATLLPDGSLLEVGTESSWELLAPGAHAWCPPRATPPSAQVLSPLVVIGSQLWWIGSGSPPTAHHTDVATIAC